MFAAFQASKKRYSLDSCTQMGFWKPQSEVQTSQARISMVLVSCSANDLNQTFNPKTLKPLNP